MESDIRVLLVDDEVDFITMMQFWLKKRGFVVDVLFSGDTVADQVRRNQYHIMFLDLKLPGVDGLQILKSIRQFSKIPVIIFSAFGTQQAIKEATELGISGFFAKEKGFEEATRLIHTAIRIHKNIRSSEGGGSDHGS